MNALMNQVQLIGRLGADAEIKTTSQGARVSNFRVATNERMKLNNGQWREVTQWHSCVVWGDLTKIVERFGHKGNLFMLSGALQYHEYTDTHGIKRNVAEIKVSQILVLDSSRSETNTDTVAAEINEEELPF
ncbi:single-strand DNA-binding protein [Sphingobacterium nematocida]|uniref:Single-stranded DNA-binding protein n=1 Tax=Sphingobacterium nematocida TaxID=1513896 RepID=A0A1T5E042_9SPHI|nr:single-stranded DNA-binding protein [Sphingobacterium nematocida]SKB77294.1 single-strand DNA-binding protein [Sphingobacterium nematocida]